jgi:hypothetical protein
VVVVMRLKKGRQKYTYNDHVSIATRLERSYGILHFQNFRGCSSRCIDCYKTTETNIMSS